MMPFNETQINSFDAVVEGAHQHKWKDLNYKIVRLQVPENTGILDDRNYKYRLHGRTKNFKNIQRVNGEAGDLEFAVGFLGSCDGVVLPYNSYR